MTWERGKITRKRAGIGGAAAVAVVVGALNALPSSAQSPPTPPPIGVELLTDRAVFTDRVGLRLKIRRHGETTRVRLKDASRTLVARFTLQPKARFPWHSHPGPVVVNVVQGRLTYVAADRHGDCFWRRYPAGTAFVDPGRGHVHSAYNSSSGITVLVATFYKAPAEGDLLIPAARACR